VAILAPCSTLPQGLMWVRTVMVFAKFFCDTLHKPFPVMPRDSEAWVVRDAVLDLVLSSDNQPPLVPLHAGAVLPRHGAEIAELCTTETRHVITAQRKLDHAAASWATFPALGFRQIKNFLCARVRGAGYTLRVSKRFASSTHECRAPGALLIDPLGFGRANELRTGGFRAIQPV
jgi:hypothetical protein